MNYTDYNTIKTFKTSKGYKAELKICDRQYDVHDFIEPYAHFVFWDRDLKGINTLENIGEDEALIALGLEKAENITENEGDIEYYNEGAKEILENYWIYPIDIYEHSGYSFSIGLKNGRDNRLGGVLLIDKKKRAEYRTEKEPTREDTKNIMKVFSDIYNGEVYELCVYEKDIYRNDKGQELVQRDYKDSISYLLYDTRENARGDIMENEYGTLEETEKF